MNALKRKTTFSIAVVISVAFQEKALNFPDSSSYAKQRYRNNIQFQFNLHRIKIGLDIPEVTQCKKPFQKQQQLSTFLAVEFSFALATPNFSYWNSFNGSSRNSYGKSSQSFWHKSITRVFVQEFW